MFSVKNLVVMMLVVVGLSISQSASAAGTNVNCVVPNHVVCNISDMDGIASVKVVIPGPRGPVNMVDNNYLSCPSEVEISFDSITPNFDIIVEDCDLGFQVAPPPGRGRPGRGLTR